MPSWMPGEDYYTDFKKGDAYVKVNQGFARLPGAGYAALHPELKDVDPEDHPEINKLSILADVAPYSREYNTSRLKVGKQAQGNTELQIEYEKILDRVRQTKESVISMTDRHFTAPVEELEGSVDSVSPSGITLKEYPGRKFQFSSVGMSAADMSARILGEHNNMIRSEVASEVDRRRGSLRQYLADNLSGQVSLVVPKGAAENAENIRAVILAGGTNINQVPLSCRTTKPSRARAGEAGLQHRLFHAHDSGACFVVAASSVLNRSGLPAGVKLLLHGARYFRDAGDQNAGFFRGDRTLLETLETEGEHGFPFGVLILLDNYLGSCGL